MMNEDSFEIVRERYESSQTQALFVGESRPAGNTFLYSGDSVLFIYTRQAFRAWIDPTLNRSEFLDHFRAIAYYVVDLCEQSVNGLPHQNRESPSGDFMRDCRAFGA
jgi:hypothetical protein